MTMAVIDPTSTRFAQTKAPCPLSIVCLSSTYLAPVLESIPFFTVKGGAIFVKLDAPFSFQLWLSLVYSITDYGECPCVGKLSPVTLTRLYSSIMALQEWLYLHILLLSLVYVLAIYFLLVQEIHPIHNYHSYYHFYNICFKYNTLSFFIHFINPHCTSPATVPAATSRTWSITIQQLSIIMPLLAASHMHAIMLVYMLYLHLLIYCTQNLCVIA